LDPELKMYNREIHKRITEIEIVEIGSNGAEQDKAINAGLFGSGERSFFGLPSNKRMSLY